MNKLSNKKLLQLLTRVLYIAVFAKIISLGLVWFLPAQGIDLQESKNYSFGYKRYSFSNFIEAVPHSQEGAIYQESTTTAFLASIDSIVLKGLYGTQKHGFAIVAQKAKPNKTTLVGVGEQYQGYTLKSIDLKSVIFTKNSKEYVLSIEEKRRSSAAATYKKRKTRGMGDVEDVHEVHRSDIQYYSKNPTKIWKDISIKEVFKGSKIDGFKVTKVRRGSKMATLGLQKGDIIIKANNVRLDSYKAVMDLYKNINNIDAIELIVLRNNEEKEIVYEIR